MKTFNLDGTEVFVPHGSVVVEKTKVTKIWATTKSNDGNIWRVKDKILEDSRLVTCNGSFDHFLEFENISTGEIRYGGTTVGDEFYRYIAVSKERAFLEAD